MPNITVQQYKPSEVIAIFNNILVLQNNQARLVCIRGLYLAGKGIPYNGFYYDVLRDESSVHELPIKISEAQRKELTPNNLVEIIGTLGRKITTKSEIKLELSVSRVEILKKQVIDENEMKRIEYRQRKVTAGFKNVDSILESLLFNGTRPRIVLVLATSSITLKDFEDGIRAARVALDFFEERVTFTQTASLCYKLKELDQKGYDVIALVRGGGIDSTTDVDKPEVIETIVGLKTPFISGVGHQLEKIFLRQVADKWTATPQGLGQYFSDIVESVSKKKTKSLAVITEQIKKQFKEQLEKSNKQNDELQKQLKAQTEQNAKQFKDFNENLKNLQDTNSRLQRQLSEALAKADSKIWKTIAIIFLIVTLALLIFK